MKNEYCVKENMKNQKKKKNKENLFKTGHNTIANESYVWYHKTSIQPITTNSHEIITKRKKFNHKNNESASWLFFKVKPPRGWAIEIHVSPGLTPKKASNLLA